MRALILLPAFILTLSSMGTAMADHRTRFHIPAELRGAASVPACDNPRVLKKISKKFRSNNVHNFDSTLKIENLTQARETDYIGNPADQNDRRFCVADSTLTNGTHPTVYYLIQERHGGASLKWGVEYCISGFDPERAHGADCRSLRAPF